MTNLELGITIQETEIGSNLTAARYAEALRAKNVSEGVIQLKLAILLKKQEKRAKASAVVSAPTDLTPTITEYSKVLRGAFPKDDIAADALVMGIAEKIEKGSSIRKQIRFLDAAQGIVNPVPRNIIYELRKP